MVVRIVLDPTKYLKGFDRVVAATDALVAQIDKVTSTVGKNVAANIGEGLTAATRQAARSSSAIGKHLQTVSTAATTAGKAIAATTANMRALTAASAQAATTAARIPAGAAVVPGARRPAGAPAATRGASRVGAIGGLGGIANAGMLTGALRTLPPVLGAIKSVKDFATFEQTLVRAGSAAGLTAKQIDQMGDAALGLSKDLGMSATSIAGTFDALLRGGLGIDRVLSDAGRNAAMLAEIAQTSADQASESIVKILSVFHRENLDAANAVNTLSAAADASVISINDMMLSLAQGASLAAAAGQSYQDTTAAIAMLGNAGLVASDAGTSLKTFFQQLTDVDAAKKLRAIGVNALDAAGNVKPLRDIIAELNRAVKDLPTGARLQALTSVFGSDAARAAEVFASGGVAAFDKIKSSMQGALTVGEKYAQLQGTLSFQLKAFWAQVERTAITIGTHLAPVLQSVTATLQSMLQRFEALPAPMQRVLVLAGALGTTLAALSVASKLAGLGGLTGLATSVFAPIKMAITGIGTAVSAVVAVLGGPLTAALAAATVAVAGLVYWVVGPEGLSQAWESVSASIKRFAEKAYGFLYNFRFNVSQLTTWFADNWRTILTDVGMMWITAHANMAHNVGVVVKTTMRIFEALGGFLSSLWDRIWTVDFWVSVGKGLKRAFDTFVEWIDSLANTLTNFFVDAAKQWVKIFTGGAIDFTFEKGNFAAPSDFERGKSDITGTIKSILKDAFSELRSPLEGFNAKTPAPNLAFYTRDVFADVKSTVASVANALVARTKEYGATLVSKLEQASKLFWNPKDFRNNPLSMMGFDPVELRHDFALGQMADQQKFIDFRNRMNEELLDGLEASRKQATWTAPLWRGGLLEVVCW
ncbi:MAG: phage tail tape measure protein [Planctomycetota bacterium]|nr:MAG: phage tail tape measure protein [Planctomycetota bacterium]